MKALVSGSELEDEDLRAGFRFLERITSRYSTHTVHACEFYLIYRITPGETMNMHGPFRWTSHCTCKHASATVSHSSQRALA